MIDIKCKKFLTLLDNAVFVVLLLQTGSTAWAKKNDKNPAGPS
ncbi:hypothetical protein DSUL_50140 [Desulfovibrionales bacterium]